MKDFIKQVAVVLVSVGIAMVTFGTGVQDRLGSVAVSNEYIATSSAASSVYGATVSSSRIIKTGPGALGQVTITGANTGVVNFYNATTTNVNLRTGQKATSTILIASLPASLAAGTYVFDAQFTDGLFIDVVSGNAPTTTILYR